MKYLVVSQDALNRSIKSSEHFPCIVEAPEYTYAEDVISRCFATEFKPRDGKTFIVVPMTNAIKVTFHRPRPEYRTVAIPYE